MSGWPKVIGELETVKKLGEGFSIARFGDGEFKLMAGGHQVREPANPQLANELRAIISAKPKKCLIAIPTMNSRGPKYASWVKHTSRFGRFLDSGRTYYSAFISRPDSAPWIFTREYVEIVSSLISGKRVSVVCEPQNRMFKFVESLAGEVLHTPCPHRQTYSVLDEIEDKVARDRSDVAVLSCGPAATCLAYRLSKRGLQALDFGSMGGFMLKAMELEH